MPIRNLAHLVNLIANGETERRYIKEHNEFDFIGAAINRIVGHLGLVSHQLHELKVRKDDLSGPHNTIQIDDQVLLQSIHEGLVIIDSSLRIGPQVSQAGLELLGEEKIAGQNFFELLKEKTISSDHEVDALSDACQMAFNLFVVEQFEELIKSAPKMFPIHLGEHSLLYRFNLAPIIENDSITNIIITFSDESSQQAFSDLESYSATKFLDGLIQIHEMTLDPWKADALADFIYDSRSSLQKILDVIDEDFDVDFVFRHLHTLMGSARALGLDALAKVAHSAEGYIGIRRGGRKFQDKEATVLKAELMSMFDALQALNQILKKDVSGSVSKNEVNDWSKKWEVFTGDVNGSMGDISLELGKAVAIEWDLQQNMSSTDFRIFKNSIIHLLRNSLDHGIETPDVRSAKGKNETGQIRVEISLEAGVWSAVVSDDGQGINCEKLREKAMEAGLETPPLEIWTLNDILQTLCHPGLSSRDVVSDISGRGVGMDAVLMEIVEVGGNLSLLSTSQTGTTFQLTWPANDLESQPLTA